MITKHKDGLYYKLLDDITNIGYEKHQHIPKVIKPDVAVRDKDVNWSNVNANICTRDSYETANTCNFHFNTIGNKSNPNYQQTPQTCRITAREIDKPYDFEPDECTDHQETLQNLNSDASQSEMRHHADELKNDKKIYVYVTNSDNLRALNLKKSINVIDITIQLIFHHWKNTA